jgi:hypothetical protein
MIGSVSLPSSSGSRVLPRDVLELKALIERQPELAAAANLQIDLIEAVRRVHGRITTPWIETPTETLSARLSSGQPLLEFAQIAFDWSDVRLLIRQVTDVLRRHEVIDAPTSAKLHSIGRSSTLPEGASAARRPRTLDTADVSDLRRGAGVLGNHDLGRAAAGVRPLSRSLGVQSNRVPILR